MRTTKEILTVIFVGTWLAVVPCVSQTGGAWTNPKPDERFKADLLLVVAHPDDETAVGALLGKLVFDEWKKLAVVYCNRGTGGGNSFGNEQGEALGAIREIEARRALSSFGVSNVWFLDGVDTPGQDVFRSLQKWNHGKILADLVRMIRLTRPEVLLTWLPAHVAGENHGDHQAAGVIATEAFSLAGDPAVFPTQITPPRERTDVDNITEGLRPWQTKKLYYVSDANHPISAAGPAIDLQAVSRTRRVPLIELAAQLHKEHRTQSDVAKIAFEAERTKDDSKMNEWVKLYRPIFGKSLVPCSPGADIFEGVTSAEVPFGRPIPAGTQRKDLLRLGGPFEFYENFWLAHGLEHLGRAFSPELEIAVGSYVHVPLLLHNSSSDSLDVTLTPEQPLGWKPLSGSGRYRLAPGETQPVETFFIAASTITHEMQELFWNAFVKGKKVAAVKLRVKVSEWALPQ